MNNPAFGAETTEGSSADASSKGDEQGEGEAGASVSSEAGDGDSAEVDTSDTQTGDGDSAEATSTGVDTVDAETGEVGSSEVDTGDGDGDGDAGDGDGDSLCPDESPSICEPTLAGVFLDGECDPYKQDCQSGKCLPVPGAAVSFCSLVISPGNQLGDPCTHGVDADDCDAGLVCVTGTGEGGPGICREICGCGPAYPTCQSGGTVCVTLEVGFAVCMPSCDPLAQDCGDGQSCIANPGGFSCVPAVGDLPVGYGCSTLADCAAGLSCLQEEGATGFTCHQLCDTQNPECPPGQICGDFVNPIGTCHPHVGACAGG